MATKQEIEKELKIALKEVGKIVPWYDDEVQAWIFSHDAYPSVECGGFTKAEVIKKYPLYLKEFIMHRLNGNISPLAEKETKGLAGVRQYVKQKDKAKESKRRIYVPVDIAEWLPNHFQDVRRLMSNQKMKHA